MLQLLQSPSPRVQRLIKEQCQQNNNIGPKELIKNNRKAATNVSPSIEEPTTFDSDDGAKGTILGATSPRSDRQDHGNYDQGMSESLVDEINDDSVVSSHSSSSRSNLEPANNQRRISRVVDAGRGILVASSSVSSLTPSSQSESIENEREDGDEDEDEEENSSNEETSNDERQ